MIDGVLVGCQDSKTLGFLDFLVMSLIQWQSITIQQAIRRKLKEYLVSIPYTDAQFHFSVCVVVLE